MAGTIGSGGSLLREAMLGVKRIAGDLTSDQSRAALLGAAVDRLAGAADLDPSLRNLASMMKEVVTPSNGTPLLDPGLRADLLQATVDAAIRGVPVGAGVGLALAARQAVGENLQGEAPRALQRTLQQIAETSDPQAAFLAQVAVAAETRDGHGEVALATIKAIAEQSDARPKSDALVNEQLMFCQNKSPERVREDLQRRLASYDVIIGTKANSAQYEALCADPAFQDKHVAYDNVSHVLTVSTRELEKKGLIVQVVGGPDDLPVAEEARGIAEAMGNRVERITADQVKDSRELLGKANVVLTLCGAQADLPNAVAALTDKPVIAMPTKERFGEGLEGAQKLIPQLAEAAPGVSYVNIDNGFGAAYVADKVNRNASKPPSDGFVVVTTAGTADIPVAEKAAQAAEALGDKVLRLYDHGVNDPSGLAQIEQAYRDAKAVIVAAGLEGGLSNHVAAVTQSPVIAVPTSVGYGTGRGGVAAMLCALNACAPGIVTVAIDAAVKAAEVAHKVSSPAT